MQRVHGGVEHLPVATERLGLGAYLLCKGRAVVGTITVWTSSASSCGRRKRASCTSFSVHTVRRVIGNAETIMEIVPRADDLVLEAKIAPALGVRVTARMDGLQADAAGFVTRISADLNRDQQGNSGQPAPAYYTIRISLRPRRWRASRTSASFPGCRPRRSSRPMNAPRSNFLLKPLQEQIARAFRER